MNGQAAMTDNHEVDASTLLSLTVEIVAAHLGANQVAAAGVPQLIASVHGALAGLGAPDTTEPAPQPAVSVRASVKSDHLVCLEDGRKLKTLRRHLMTAYGMTPDQYRAKWNLPADYPMVAPAYSARRSELAKAGGLGRRKGAAPAHNQIAKDQALISASSEEKTPRRTRRKLGIAVS